MSHKNILILCTDEYRGDLLAANGLNPDIRTPQMDALAARGVNFRRHFTTFPKCVPARISMMTGRYTHTDGYRNIEQHLPLGQPDLASTLREKRYQLVEFGRNHCWENMLEASHRPPELAPDQQGLVFDHHAWTDPFKAIWEKHRKQDRDLERRPPASLEQGLGFVHADNKSWFADEAVTEMTDLFLRDIRDPDRAFFCQVNLSKPHPGYEVGSPWFEMYDRSQMKAFPHQLPANAPYCVQKQREVRTGMDCHDGVFLALQSTYMGMCSKIDSLIGRMIESLEAAGLWEETIVVVTSDHGDYAGQYGLPEKWDTHFPDCLMHVPMVMAGGGLPTGLTVDQLTDHSDLAPTLCELVGVDPFPGIQGRSMRPTIHGRATREAVFGNGGHEPQMRDRFNFYAQRGRPNPTATPESFSPRPDHSDKQVNGKQETYRLFPQSMARAKMVRTLHWKYVHRETGDHELYDLQADRWELCNLYPLDEPGHLAEVSHLRQLLLDWTLRTDPDRPWQAGVGA